MAEDRLRVIMGHVNGQADVMQALGVINPHATAQSLYQKHKNKGFQYTLNNQKLSVEQRKFYEENGYLFLENLIPTPLVDSLRLRFQEIREGKLPEVKNADDHPNNNKDILENAKMAFFNDILNDYFTFPQLLDYIECFCGQNIVVQHCMLPTYDFSSVSVGGNQFCPIQDEANCAVYPINRAVCCLSSLESPDLSNRYVTLCPGSHQISKKGKPVDTSKKVLLELKQGDILLYHPLLFHDFGADRCKDCRKAISCWFIASECHQRKPPQNPNSVPHHLVKGKRIIL